MTNKKFVSFFLMLFTVLLGGVIAFSPSISRADYNYPAGCYSTYGISTTTGLACNNTSMASYVSGCYNTTNGYSTTSGISCSGNNSVTYANGCTSTYGVSNVNGLPCNGTSNAYVNSGYPIGCYSNSGYSPTSGILCNGSNLVSNYPSGCSSSVGLSTTGSSCNGTSTPTYVSGCTSILGTSTTSGIACNGTSSSLNMIPGCYSNFGYSTITNQPCNGTNDAVVISFYDSSTTNPSTPPSGTPGLPTTGKGGEALLNGLVLIVATLGLGLSLSYFRRKSLKLS